MLTEERVFVNNIISSHSWTASTVTDAVAATNMETQNKTQDKMKSDLDSQLSTTGRVWVKDQSLFQLWEWLKTYRETSVIDSWLKSYLVSDLHKLFIDYQNRTWNDSFFTFLASQECIWLLVKHSLGDQIWNRINNGVLRDPWVKSDLKSYKLWSNVAANILWYTIFLRCFDQGARVLRNGLTETQILENLMTMDYVWFAVLCHIILDRYVDKWPLVKLWIVAWIPYLIQILRSLLMARKESKDKTPEEEDYSDVTSALKWYREQTKDTKNKDYSKYSWLIDKNANKVINDFGIDTAGKSADQVISWITEVNTNDQSISYNNIKYQKKWNSVDAHWVKDIYLPVIKSVKAGCTWTVDTGVLTSKVEKILSDEKYIIILAKKLYNINESDEVSLQKKDEIKNDLNSILQLIKKDQYHKNFEKICGLYKAPEPEPTLNSGSSSILTIEDASTRKFSETDWIGTLEWDWDRFILRWYKWAQYDKDAETLTIHFEKDDWEKKIATTKEISISKETYDWSVFSKLKKYQKTNGAWTTDLD
jgi:hypothetical protein